MSRNTYTSLYNRKTTPFGVVFLIEFSVLATTYFGPCGLSSALRRLTSLFGMGRGGATASNHQNRELNHAVLCGKR